MKKASFLFALLLVFSGCSARGEMDRALELRSRLLSQSCGFTCHVTADYFDSLEIFSLQCGVEGDKLSFRVSGPESIEGITGAVEGEEGVLTFGEEILAFPLMAGGRLSPVSAPALMMKALRSGYITSCGMEGELLRISVNDSYADDALNLEVWVGEDGIPTAAEIGWQGRRMVSMELEGFVFS